MSSKQELVESMVKMPSRYFVDPSHVANYPGLNHSDRVDILRSWKHDVIMMMKAAEENMSSDKDYDLDSINKALDKELGEDT